MRLYRAAAIITVALGLLAFGAQVGAEQAPPATQEQVFVIGNARFTVLSPTLLRLEHSPTATFVDLPTMLIANRTLEPVEFDVREAGGVFELVTERLGLRYTGKGARFSARNLEITVFADPDDVIWRPGMNAVENLGGLAGDGRRNRKGEGILTRDGWYLLDDSDTPIAGSDGWPIPRDSPLAQDLYFFGYSGDYVQALKDFHYLTGGIPLPPRWTFGLWFASNWPHKDVDLLQTVRQFDEQQVPLDALILSFWHRFGWTGYDWNVQRFPDPRGFMQRLDSMGVQLGLKVYPGGALQPLHKRYAEVAERVSLLLERAGLIFFDFGQRVEADAYFDVLIRPLNTQGVDFWWAADGAANTIRNLPRQLWSNRLFFMRTRPERRGLIEAPYGGLGSSRFPITTLNDVEPNWTALSRMPQTIATAGNEGVAFVAHGVRHDKLGDELLVRWMQFAAFTPVMQIISGEDTDRLWEMDEGRSEIVRRFLNLRKSLVPYLYSTAYQAHRDGLPMCRPLYLHFPGEPMAYNVHGEYMLGDNLLAAPVTEPAAANGVTTRIIWFPPGIWTDIFTNRMIEGPSELHYTVPLELAPVFARAGSIIPRLPPDGNGNLLLLDVFPGKEGEFILYEDDGDTNEYLAGRHSECRVSYVESERVRLVRIGRYEGFYDTMPVVRSYLLRVHVILPVESVSLNYRELPYVSNPRTEVGWHYLPDDGIVLVRTPPVSISDTADVLLLSRFNPEDRELAYRLREIVSRLESALVVLRQDEPADAVLPEPLAELSEAVRQVMQDTERRALDISCPPVSRQDIEEALAATREDLKLLVARGNDSIMRHDLKLSFMRIVAGVRMSSRIIPTPYREVIVRTDIEHMAHSWGELSGVVKTEDQPPRELMPLEPRGSAFKEDAIPVGTIKLDDIAYTVRAELVWNGVPIELTTVNVLPNTYITQFYLIGPFGDTGYGRVMELAYPPEEQIDLAASYLGKRRTPLRWEINTWQAPVHDYLDRDYRVVDFTRLLQRMPPSVGYAYTLVFVPEDVEARLIIASEDELALFVNGTLVFRHTFPRRHLPESPVNIRLNAGWNDLLVKTNDGGRLWGFSMRLVDRFNKPIPGAVSGWGRGFE